MPRKQKTLEQLRLEAEKSKQLYEEKIELERKVVIEQFFKDNPEIITWKDYKEFKKNEIKEEPKLSKNDKELIEFATQIKAEFEVSNIEELRTKLEQSKVETDEISEATKSFFDTYESKIMKTNNGKFEFNPRNEYYNFLEEFYNLKLKFIQSK
jgi:hypothetical protein